MENYKLPSDWMAERAKKLDVLERFFFDKLAERKYPTGDETMTAFDSAVIKALAEVRQAFCDPENPPRA